MSQDGTELTMTHELKHNAKGQQYVPLHTSRKSEEGDCPMVTDAINRQQETIDELRDTLEKQQKLAQSKRDDSQRLASEMRIELARLRSLEQ
eukprot:16283172-Heterocapsa_arctica.AAC.1